MRFFLLLAALAGVTVLGTGCGDVSAPSPVSSRDNFQKSGVVARSENVIEAGPGTPLTTIMTACHGQVIGSVAISNTGSKDGHTDRVQYFCAFNPRQLETRPGTNWQQHGYKPSRDHFRGSGIVAKSGNVVEAGPGTPLTRITAACDGPLLGAVAISNTEFEDAHTDRVQYFCAAPSATHPPIVAAPLPNKYDSGGDHFQNGGVSARVNNTVEAGPGTPVAVVTAQNPGDVAGAVAISNTQVSDGHTDRVQYFFVAHHLPKAG